MGVRVTVSPWATSARRALGQGAPQPHHRLPQALARLPLAGVGPQEPGERRARVRASGPHREVGEEGLGLARGQGAGPVVHPQQEPAQEPEAEPLHPPDGYHRAPGMASAAAGHSHRDHTVLTGSRDPAPVSEDSSASALVVTFMVRITCGRDGRLRGTVERVRTGEKERFTGADGIGSVIERMLREDS